MLERALREDAVDGDVTTSTLLGGSGPPPSVSVSFVARGAGVVCGLPVLAALYGHAAPEVAYRALLEDGDRVAPGQTILELEGPAPRLLALERTALNFLGRLGGIASWTARWVELVAGTGAGLYDTRKTTPGWRYLEKYAVRTGGGNNHRMHLGDGALVKDNHVALLRALGRWDPVACVASFRRAAPGTFVELEVDGREEFLAALAASPDAILLDNFTPEDARWAVSRRAEPGSARPLLEASGGITFETVRVMAETGVDRISVGALTHSAPVLDIGLDIGLDTSAPRGSPGLGSGPPRRAGRLA